MARCFEELSETDSSPLFLTKTVKINQKTFKLYNGIIIAKYLIHIYNNKQNWYKSSILISALLATIKCLVAGIIRAYYTQHFFGETIEELVIFILNAIGVFFLSFKLFRFFFICLIDMDRRDFLLKQVGHMASVNALDKFWDQKLMPTIDLTCIHSINSWVFLRAVSSDYGRKFFYRHQILMSLMFSITIIHFVLLLEIKVLRIFNFLEEIEADKFFALLIFEFTTCLIMTMTILHMASRINSSFANHREIILNNLNLTREIYEFRQFYFRDFLKDKKTILEERERR